MKTNSIKYIGLLLPRYFKFYAHEVVAGMVEYAAQHQHIHFKDLRFNHLDQAGEQLRKTRVDGLIFGLNRLEFDFLKDALPRRKPMVNLHPAILRQDIPTVCIDGASKSRVVFDYLASLGYRHFASFGNTQGGYLDESASELEALALAAGFSHTAGGMAFPRSTYDSPTPLTADPAVDAWLQALPKPVGIVCGGGYSAIFIEQSVARLGFDVPGDVAVVSRSDDEVCLFADPPISAVRQLGPEVGGLALRLLDETLAGGVHPQGRITIPSPDLIERRSSGFPSGLPEDMKRAVRYIREHACEGIDVADILRHVPSLSRTRLYKLFPIYFGCSPASEILRIRLDEATRLLVHTHLSVGMVGERCGFGSHSRFTEAYRNHFGITPLAQRKQRAISTTI